MRNAKVKEEVVTVQWVDPNQPFMKIYPGALLLLWEIQELTTNQNKFRLWSYIFTYININHPSAAITLLSFQRLVLLDL